MNFNILILYNSLHNSLVTKKYFSTFWFNFGSKVPWTVAHFIFLSLICEL